MIGIPLTIIVTPYVRAFIHGIVDEWRYRRWLKEKGYLKDIRRNMSTHKERPGLPAGLPNKLLAWAKNREDLGYDGELLRQAADEIEKLRARVEELEEDRPEF